MEPIRHQEPENNFLQRVREIANETDAVLIFDEITAGWRLTIGGSHLLYNVNPDMMVTAKAISNGYPMAAVIGKAEINPSNYTEFIHSIRTAFLIFAVLCFIGIFFSLARGKSK